MNWGAISDIILISSFAVLAVFALLGFCQLVKRKSFFKVDKPLICMFIPLILILLTYVTFNTFFILNTSPSDPTKPSFPSSHVLATITIFACVALALPYYVESKATRIFFDIIMLILAILVSIGRVLSGEHWISDVVAAFIFSGIYVAIYYLTIRRTKNV